MSVQSSLFRFAENSPAPVPPGSPGSPLVTGRSGCAPRHSRRLSISWRIADDWGPVASLLFPQRRLPIFGELSARDAARQREALDDPEGKLFGVAVGADGDVFVRMMS